jgi:hypothetical protein
MSDTSDQPDAGRDFGALGEEGLRGLGLRVPHHRKTPRHEKQRRDFGLAQIHFGAWLQRIAEAAVSIELKLWTMRR